MCYADICELIAFIVRRHIVIVLTVIRTRLKFYNYRLYFYFMIHGMLGAVDKVGLADIASVGGGLRPSSPVPDESSALPSVVAVK